MKTAIYILVSFFVFGYSSVNAQLIEMSETGRLLPKATGFGSSLACNIDVACDPEANEIKKGIFWLNNVSAFFVNNALHDGRLLFMTASHAFPPIAVGGTVMVDVKFGYESVCDSDQTPPEHTAIFTTVKLLARTSRDQVLCEFIDEDLPAISISMLGWDTREEMLLESSLVVIGHPKADVKKITYPTLTGYTSISAFVKVEIGDGAMEVGHSGAPLIGRRPQGTYVYGLVNSGSIYDCARNPQSSVTLNNIGSDWAKLAPFLDPLGNGIEYCGPLAAVLPVELSSFAASVLGSTVDLKWSTATEINNYGFEIERKSSFNWETIGFVGGNGNSNSPKEYSFCDQNLSAGKYAYRLKQIDTDGKFDYSKAVLVLIKPKQLVLNQNYPNPFNPSTRIEYTLPKHTVVTLEIYDVLGKEVATLVNEEKPAGEYEVLFDASNLSSGVYFYKLTTGNQVVAKKMIFSK